MWVTFSTTKLRSLLGWRERKTLGALAWIELFVLVFCRSRLSASASVDHMIDCQRAFLGSRVTKFAFFLSVNKYCCVYPRREVLSNAFTEVSVRCSACLCMFARSNPSEYLVNVQYLYCMFQSCGSFVPSDKLSPCNEMNIVRGHQLTLTSRPEECSEVEMRDKKKSTQLYILCLVLSFTRVPFVGRAIWLSAYFAGLMW